MAFIIYLPHDTMWHLQQHLRLSLSSVTNIVLGKGNIIYVFFLSVQLHEICMKYSVTITQYQPTYFAVIF